MQKIFKKKCSRNADDNIFKMYLTFFQIIIKRNIQRDNWGKGAEWKTRTLRFDTQNIFYCRKIDPNSCRLESREFNVIF